MSANKLTTAAIAVLLVLAAAVPAAAADGSADAGNEASGSITVTVATTEDGTTITFEQGGEAYTDATVDVSAVGDASYRGSGSYAIDADGSVHLPAPEDDVTVRVEVTGDDVHASGVVVLSAYHGIDTETSVTIEAEAAGGAAADGSADDGHDDARDSNDDAEGSDGEHDSDAAESSGTADADGDGYVSLGERLSAFVHGIARVDLGGIGESVSAFAVGNTPADAADDVQAGADANASGSASADVDAGNGAADGRVGIDDGSAGVSAAGSSDAPGSDDSSGSADSNGDGDGDEQAGATVSGSAETRGNANANGAASAEATANGEAEGGWLFGLISWI